MQEKKEIVTRLEDLFDKYDKPLWNNGPNMEFGVDFKDKHAHYLARMLDWAKQEIPEKDRHKTITQLLTEKTGQEHFFPMGAGMDIPVTWLIGSVEGIMDGYESLEKFRGASKEEIKKRGLSQGIEDDAREETLTLLRVLSSPYWKGKQFELSQYQIISEFNPKAKKTNTSFNDWEEFAKYNEKFQERWALREYVAEKMIPHHNSVIGYALEDKTGFKTIEDYLLETANRKGRAVWADFTPGEKNELNMIIENVKNKNPEAKIKAYNFQPGEPSPTQPKPDLITSMYGLNTETDLLGTITKMYNSLNEEGIMLVNHHPHLVEITPYPESTRSKSMHLPGALKDFIEKDEKRWVNVDQYTAENTEKLPMLKTLYMKKTSDNLEIPYKIERARITTENPKGNLRISYKLKD